ncbi:MAG: F0F1 ATP synthase subunit epsilon [Candidatus Pacebacteria bacterium]|nr:F0F1 ATP synthase subunit epsilon [Candidatus Paceibacterota bacterium]
MSNQELLHVTVTKVDGPVFDGDAISLSVPGTEGDMEILAHHAAIITSLRKGTIKVTKPDGDVETHDLKNGTLEVSNNRAILLI